MELAGALNYLVFFVTIVGIYGILCLGLNVQWGLTGLFNIGIAAFFAVGAYSSAIVTAQPDNVFVAGLGLPFVAGLAVAMIASAVLAAFVGLITLRLRADYLAIASIGIAEIVRLFLKNEDWLTNGVRGVGGILRPFGAAVGSAYNLVFMAIVLVAVVLVYLALERARRAPWGRVLRAIRENENTALASGKNVLRFRLQAFVLGSSIMGLAGALYAHFVGFISPEAFEPMLATFLVWVMLIAGGSGNNRGALIGAVVIWGLWSGTELLTGLLPADWITRAGALRVFLIGILLVAILLYRPEGVLSEEAQRRADLERERRQ